MASQTSNLGLALLGTSLADKETYFEAWRLTMNGEMDDSNMQIIDDAYGDMSEEIQGIKDGAISDETINSLVDNIFNDNGEENNGQAEDPPAEEPGE